MSVNIEEQYDKIYRYCYFKLHHQQTAEDITQETFLRYFQRYDRITGEAALKCLYTIARNLCIDEYRRQSKDFVQEEYITEDSKEDQILTALTVRAALAGLTEDEQELLLLRYVNEVPVAAISQMLGISRFAVRRRLLAVQKKFQHILEKTGGI